MESRDVAEALRLMNVATQKAAMDPRTGTIDMDMITTGVAASDRESLRMLVAEIKSILEHPLPHASHFSIAELRQEVETQRSHHDNNLVMRHGRDDGSNGLHLPQHHSIKHAEFQTALRTLEEDNVIQILHGQVRYLGTSTT